MSIRTLVSSCVIAAAMMLLPPASAEPLFVDEFDGDSLSDSWEVLNEDPDAYVVEDGNLLIIASGDAHISKGPVPNVIRLKSGLPKGNWVATIKFTVPYQTGREAPFLGIYEDEKNQIIATTNSWSYYEAIRGARLYLSGWRITNGREASFAKVIWGGASGVAYTAEQPPNPFYLRITKKGRSYIPAYRLEGMKQEEWIEHEKFTVLRPKGSLAIGIFQAEKVAGETLMMVDSFKIEPLN